APLRVLQHRPDAATDGRPLPAEGRRRHLGLLGDEPGNPTALKTYGMLLADNGGAWFVTGAPDPRWDNEDLHALTTIPGSSFEAVDESGLMVDPDSGQVQ